MLQIKFLGGVFDKFVVSTHAIDRYVERFEECDRLEVEKKIKSFCNKGDLITNLDDHVLVIYDDMIFPCVKISDGCYKVKSVLMRDYVRTIC